MRKRNPMARDLRVNPLYRPRKGKSLRDQEGRADRWSRAAKHKQPKGTPGSAHGLGDFVRGRFQPLVRSTGKSLIRLRGDADDRFSSNNFDTLSDRCRPVSALSLMIDQTRAPSPL